MARNIIVTQIDGVPYTTRPMAVCTTAAGTAAKTANYSGFSLDAGATLLIRFTNGNTASNPTLNVGGTGAKGLYYGGGYLPSGILNPNITYELIFDGEYWQILGAIPDHGKNTVTNRAGTNTSGTTITIPFVSVNTTTGHVTNLGTRTHTIPGIDTSVIDTLQSTITQQQQQINDLKSTLESIITGKTWSPSIWGSGDGTTGEGSGGEETEESSSTPIMTGQPS